MSTKEMARWFVAAPLAVLLVVGSTSAQESSSPLQVKLMLKSPRYGMGKATIVNAQDFEVRLINSGKKPVVVFTAIPDFQFSDFKEAKKGLEVSIGFVSKEFNEERLVVPSLTSLKPVKLLPGEEARLELRAGVTQRAFGMTRDLVSDLKLNNIEIDTSLTVHYEVSQFWGSRFDAWHGKESVRLNISSKEFPKR